MIQTGKHLVFPYLNVLYFADEPCTHSFINVSDIESDEGTISGGVYKDGDSFGALFPCRADLNGAVVPGTAWKTSSGIECYVTYDGTRKRQHNANFEVLTGPENHKFVWLKKATDGAIPKDAIVGGRNKNLPDFYVARCKVPDNPRVDYAIEWVAAGTKKAGAYGKDRASRECMDYEILVCTN